MNATGKKDGWKSADVRPYKPGTKVTLLSFPKLAIPVNDLIPGG